MTLSLKCLFQFLDIFLEFVKNADWVQGDPCQNLLFELANFDLGHLNRNTHWSSLFPDYDAPLSENGGYTPKYEKAAEMIAKYDHLAEVITKPEKPEHVAPRIYPDVKLTEVLTFNQIVENVVRFNRLGLSEWWSA